ncbi:P-loop containing nucleoside triphosphate hydrolase protein [Mycena albidolilacea]|uniref:P-loop containing nucleoside triphosphate hydrolase protein n=1 Tax=Mycena albidolilacea TaxID=1033008 RepID=A0AAD7F5Z7_9AGAR|nr:P-loop containing nucleoside triphosphate hydrolase protein [Mycena albidolilacea]
MRLAACVPTIPAHIVASLETCGIRTDADLLFSGSTLEILRRLPAGTTTLRELARFTALVENLVSAPGQCAADLLKEPEDADFLSGLPQLDEILNGLTTPGRLVEVSGDKGSGKTSLLLHLVLHHLVHHTQSSVLWIDTKGDFSALRAAEILELYDAPGAPLALERLQVSVAFEVDALHEVLEELRLSLSSSAAHLRTRAIVVDTVTPLFGPLLSPVSSQGHAIMTSSMRQLRAFAEFFSLTVFVVNDSAAFTPFVPGSVSNNPNIRKPALGPSFSFLTDATLWLALYGDDTDPHERDTGAGCTKHLAQVYRSKVTVSQVWRAFKIRQGVLLDCEQVP